MTATVSGDKNELHNGQYAIARRYIPLKEEYLDLDYLSFNGKRVWWEHNSKYINDCCCKELSKAEEALTPNRKFPYLHGKENTFDK